MPRFLRSIADRIEQKDTVPVNRYEGFQANGAVVLRDRRGTLKAELPEADTKGFGGGGDDPLAIYRPSGTKQVDAAKAMGAFTGWVYAAVNAIGMASIDIQFRLYQIKGKEHIELDDHPVLDLLEMANPDMIGLDLKYTMMAHLELTGNFYGFLDGVKSDTDQPKAIYPLHPGRVRVKINKTVFPYRIDHYEFTLDGVIRSFKPYEILHIKYPDPNDPFTGLGFPQAIPVWIDSDNYAMEYNRKYFVNGAQIGLYVQSDTNVEGNIERIKRGMRDGYAGVENAHKIPVLPKGTKLEHTGVTHKDMDFGNLADRTRDRVLAGARVSKTVLGTAESDTNRATAETADYVFSKRTMKPKLQLVVAYFNTSLVSRYGDDLYLTFIDPTPEDKEFRTMEMQAAVSSMPVMTQNEARQQYLGLGPVEGGDQLMRPSTMEAAGTTSKPEGEDMAPNLAKTVEGWATKAIRVRTGGKSAHSIAHKMRRAVADAFKSIIDQKITSDYTVKSVKDLTHTEYMEHWKRFSDRSERAVDELHQVFRRINAQQSQDVLENLPEATGVTKSLAELFDLKEWIGITIDLVTPILSSLTRDEATAALAMIGADHQDILADESIRNALERGISKMATSYNETTLEQLKKVLEEKLTQEGGTNLPELTDAVDGVYDYANERRAGLIAQTESFRAANLANKEAWRVSGVVKSVKWYTADDGKVCQFCQQQDGTEIDIDANFYDLGDTIKGADGGIMTADYSDIEAPPLHPACRCFVRPENIEI